MGYTLSYMYFGGHPFLRGVLFAVPTSTASFPSSGHFLFNYAERKPLFVNGAGQHVSCSTAGAIALSVCICLR